MPRTGADLLRPIRKRVAVTFEGPEWISCCEAALADRLAYLERLEKLPMTYASEPEKAAHVTEVYQTRRIIIEIVNDIEKAKGETS